MLLRFRNLMLRSHIKKYLEKLHLEDLRVNFATLELTVCLPESFQGSASGKTFRGLLSKQSMFDYCMSYIKHYFTHGSWGTEIDK